MILATREAKNSSAMKSNFIRLSLLVEIFFHLRLLNYHNLIPSDYQKVCKFMYLGFLVHVRLYTMLRRRVSDAFMKRKKLFIPQCLMFRDVWKALCTKIESTRKEFVTLASNFDANSCLILHLCRAISDVSKSIMDCVDRHDIPELPILGKEAEKEEGIDKTLINQLSAEMGKILGILEHFSDRLKSEDIYHRQLEVALSISKILSTKKFVYLKVVFWFYYTLPAMDFVAFTSVFKPCLLQNVYVHLAAECLKQLRQREIYSILPLEELLVSNEGQTMPQEVKDLMKSLLKSPSPTSADKVRLLILYLMFSARDGSNLVELEAMLEEETLR